MKSKIFLGIIALTLGMSTLSTPTFVHADTSSELSKQIIDWPPGFGNTSYPSYTGGVNKFSFVIYDNWRQPGFIETPRNCKDILDPKCADYASKIRSQPWGLTYNLPMCEISQPELACIESFEIGSNGIFSKVSQIGSVNGLVWPENKKYGVPLSGKPSLWKDTSTDDPRVGYVLGVHQSLQGSYLKSTPLNSMLNIQVARYVVLPKSGIPANIPSSPTTTSVSRKPYCAWQDLNQCAYKLPFLPNTSFKVIIHVSNQMTGWFYGRMKNSSLKVEPISPKLNKLSVESEPISIPFFAATVDCKDAPQFKCNTGFSVSSGVPINFPLDPIVTALHDQAIVDVPSWSLTSYSQSPKAKCKFSSTSIAGLVTSNATTFSGQPPVMENSMLTYKLSALHLDKNGEVFKGQYELQLDSSLAKCLWNLKTQKPKAEVSITSESGKSEVATSTFAAINGFFRLQANGFTFSNPTIAVKLS